VFRIFSFQNKSYFCKALIWFAWFYLSINALKGEVALLVPVIKYIDILPISIITWGVLRIISGIESYLLEHKDSAQSPVEKGLSICNINPPKIFDSISLAAKPITMPPTPPKVSRPEIEKPKYCATPSTIEAIIRILIKRAIWMITCLNLFLHQSKR
jgi:hypothetical protein